MINYIPIFIVLVVGSNFSYAKTGRSGAFQDYELTCEQDETVRGMKGVVAEDKDEKDLLIELYCGSVKSNSTATPLKCTTYRSGEPFTFNRFSTGLEARVEFTDRYNCPHGHFINGIRTALQGDSKIMQFICCEPAGGAIVDESIGCHVVGPSNPFNQGYFGLRDTVNMPDVCPENALSSVYIGPDGIALKFCPFKQDIFKNTPSECIHAKHGLRRYREDEDFILADASATTTKLISTSTTASTDGVTRAIKLEQPPMVAAFVEAMTQTDIDAPPIKIPGMPGTQQVTVKKGTYDETEQLLLADEPEDDWQDVQSEPECVCACTKVCNRRRVRNVDGNSTDVVEEIKISQMMQLQVHEHETEQEIFVNQVRVDPNSQNMIILSSDSPTQGIRLCPDELCGCNTVC